VIFRGWDQCLSFFQFFETVSWSHKKHKKYKCHLFANVLFWNKWRKQGGNSRLFKTQRFTSINHEQTDIYSTHTGLSPSFVMFSCVFLPSRRWLAWISNFLLFTSCYFKHHNTLY